MSEPLPSAEKDVPTTADLLTELRAIRAVLERREAEQALCPHGARGMCMSCVMPSINYALDEIARNITNQAWEAMRRG